MRPWGFLPHYMVLLLLLLLLPLARMRAMLLSLGLCSSNTIMVCEVFGSKNCSC